MLTLNYRSGRVAFSLVELMISLITISCIAAAFTPVITKKLKKQDIALSLAQTSEITTKCHKDETYPYGNDTDGYKCELCTKSYCINCELSCPDLKYAESQTCVCKNCSEQSTIKNDTTNLTQKKCVKCNNDGCTACNNTGADEGKYYVEKGLCLNCPTDTYTDSSGTTLNLYICDGITKTDRSKCSAPENSGYFCDRGIKKSCQSKYDPLCSTCNSNKCITCPGHYYINSSGKCVLCPNNCTGCNDCNGKDSCSKCTTCSYSRYTTADGNCVSCETIASNCDSCDSSTCYSCIFGYFYNTSRTCTQCTVSNCNVCANNKSASSPYCAECKSGYYLKNGQCYPCSNYNSNCIGCDSTGCTSCKVGYHVSEDKKTCQDNQGNWHCSESNFAQVGDICVTRRNMGDANVLKIPSTVTVVNQGETCYGTKKEKCCWKVSTDCSDYPNGGSYSGCNRTVCNWWAAYEICDKFNYLGAKWRLPTSSELSKFNSMNYNLGDNGLMICGIAGDGSVNDCGSPSGCYGCSEYEQHCYKWVIWGDGDLSDSVSSATMATVGKSISPSDRPKNGSYAVRCVTDMNNFE